MPMPTKTGPLDWMSDLPAALRFVRHARRLSLRDVAKETGLHFNNINRWEREGSDLPLKDALTLTNWIAYGGGSGAPEDGS